jgi:hypothetical protein
VSPAAESSDILKKLADLLPKIKTPVQLMGLIALVIAVILAKNSLSNAAGTAGLGMLFLAFGQVYAQLDKIPESSRASFLVQSLTRFIVALGLYLAVIVLLVWLAAKGQNANSPVTPIVASPVYPPGEQKLVDLRSEMDKIKAVYVLLLDRPDQARDVNRQSRQLAQRFLAVDDGQLSLGIQIYKYEAVAYSWAMVAGSEDDHRAKLRTVVEILTATEKGEKLVDDAMRPGLLDKKAQDTRDWIIKDNAIPRLQRLAAIAICVRWQVDKKQEDRLKVRKLIDDLPYDYVMDEQPQKSSELQPCLVDHESEPRR